MAKRVVVVPGCAEAGHFVSRFGYCLECLGPATFAETVTFVRNPRMPCETRGHYVCNGGHCLECGGPFEAEWVREDSIQTAP